MAHSLSCLRTESIRPQMSTTEIQDRVETIKQLSTPFFPLEIVKGFVIEALGRAVQLNQVHNRDPIGGSNEMLFVPLLKMIDKLLLVGVLEDDDVPQLLVLIDPETWDSSFDAQVLIIHCLINPFIHLLADSEQFQSSFRALFD